MINEYDLAANRMTTRLIDLRRDRDRAKRAVVEFEKRITDTTRTRNEMRSLGHQERHA